MREIFSRINTPVEAYAKKGVYRWRASHVAVGPLGLSVNWWGGSCGGNTPEVQDIFSLDFPLGDSRGEGDHGGTTIRYDNATGIMLSPGGPAAARLEAGYANLEIVMRRADLEAVLTALIEA